MAFGDIRGTKTGSATSITASMPCATGTDFAVVVGDLIVGLLAEQTAVTTTACADNLGNTYTPLGAGLDAGTVTGRGFYTRVTNPGTITGLTFTATASANNCVTLAVGFEGPFTVSPVDAAPTGITNDNTTPYTCPATGTLAQADEKIVCAIIHNGNPTLTATAPNLKAVELATASILKAAIGHQTVSSTASVTPAWTSSATPTASCYDTVSFKAATAWTGSVTEVADTDDSSSAVVPSTLPSGVRAFLSWVEVEAAVAAVVWTGSVAEAAATTEVSTAVEITTGARAETATVADVQSGALVTAASRSETAAVVDVPIASSLTTTVTRSEAAAAAESQSAVATLVASRTEAAVILDSQSAVETAIASLVETAAATDVAELAAIVQTGSVTETAAVSDSSAAAQAFAASASESAAAADTQATTWVTAASRTEAATSADSQAAVRVSPVSVSETATIADSPSVGPGVTNPSIVEGVVIADFATIGELVSRTEAAVIAEILTTTAIHHLARAEPAVLSDEASAELVAGAVSHTGAVTETALLADSASAELVAVPIVHVGAVTETASLADSASAVLPGEGGVVWVNHDGTWKPATVWAKHGGAWKPATVHVRDEGAWKLVA